MKHDDLLNDATGLVSSTSARAKYHRLSEILKLAGHDAPPKTIERWFARGSIPAKWLFAICDAASADGRPIDLNKYA